MYQSKVFSILLITVLSAVCCAAQKPALDGRFKGQVIAIQNAPYQAQVQVFLGQGCSGSIMSEQWILTSAHCVWQINVLFLSVRVGNANLNQGELFTVAQKFVHNQYDDTTKDFDQALLKLSSAITFSDSKQPIQVSGTPPNGLPSILVTGWNRQLAIPPIQLQISAGNLVSSITCSNVYSQNGGITASMICATCVSPNCNGESGSPLVLGSNQIGIGSWGHGCNQPSDPVVYSIPDVVWIQLTIASN